MNIFEQKLRDQWNKVPIVTDRPEGFIDQYCHGYHVICAECCNDYKLVRRVDGPRESDKCGWCHQEKMCLTVGGAGQCNWTKDSLTKKPKSGNPFAKAAMMLLCGLLIGCQTNRLDRGATVVVSEQVIILHRTGIKKPISTAKKGIGGKPESNKTPLGDLYVGVSKVGQFGPTVELHGKSIDGYEQKGRYIQIHGTKGQVNKPLSKGCVRCTYADLPVILNQLEVGDPVRIVK